MPHLLFSFRRCPYAIRARMAIAYSNYAVDIIEVDLKNKPERLLQLSSKGTVPVLVLADHTIIDESLDIMKLVLSKNDPDGWLTEKCQESEVLIKENDSNFKHFLDLYKYSVRHPEHSREFYRENAESFIQILESHLSRHIYLVDNKIRLADIAIFPFVRQFAFVDKSWFDHSPYIYTQQWLEKLLQSDLFMRVMKKSKPQIKS